MSFRGLLDPDCGGQNPIAQLAGQLSRDVTYRDEGLGRGALARPDMVQDFLQQVQPAPQTFRMNELMKEMQELEGIRQEPGGSSINFPLDLISGADWAKEFGVDNLFDSTSRVAPIRPNLMMGPRSTGPLMEVARPQPVGWTKDFFEKEEQAERQATDDVDEWVKAFEQGKDADERASGLYNREFWEKLQDEWRRISEEQDSEVNPWLSDFSEIYDPFKEYKYAEENPMIDMENALEKGKAFLAQGDIPSAVLCFEAATKQNPESAETWELLGTTQTENENDPNAIPALKKALELDPTNRNVLMSLAVSYTNESYQNQALKMLVNWLSVHPKYGHLVPASAKMPDNAASNLTESIAKAPVLREVQEMFLSAVKQNRTEVDAEVQEALGVLFNLSSEYDKAVDCYKAAVQVNPGNAKTWNRLGASLANGNRSVEAVEAYQNALEIQPGFIRARYNVGIICINLKAYKEAAEHLLTALNHQATSSSRAGVVSSNAKLMSDSIWGTLRMAISLAEMHDLQDAIEKRDLNALNAAFNEGTNP
ncbi:peroxisomal targeting signal 1 receptor [Culicoides brevitarsis]|uniref:peroxisomal targeting signal 1 receptor n=1 Tax=Culicoides brevitarsis TaxID=469753 RepID=UPI00307B3A1F